MTTPASSIPMNVAPSDSRTRYKGASRPLRSAENTHSNTQPTVSTTSSAIMTMASRMGKRKERQRQHGR